MRLHDLIPFLLCPYCGYGKLSVKDENLSCHKCSTNFEVIQGVPVLIKHDELSKQEIKQKKWFDNHYSRFSKEEYKLDNWRLSMLKRIFSNVSTKTVGRYLDIGCGATGYTIIEAARQNGWFSIGIDISLEAMIKAKNLAEKQGVGDKTAFLVCSAEHLPFKGGFFDYVSAISLLEHLEDDEKVIEEIYKVLISKGFLYICVPNTYWKMWPFLWPIYYYLDKQIGHKRHYSLKSIKNLMEGYILKDFFYNAHLRKLLEITFEKFGLSSEKRWWEVEKNDIDKNPTGIQLNAIFQKG